MNTLVAYIPVINRQYLDWLKRHQPFKLFLIPQSMAQEVVPQLARNLISLSELEVQGMIRSFGMDGQVEILDPYSLPFSDKFILPDEDVCHTVSEQYLRPDPLYCGVEFETIWGRWDMTAVKRQQPVIPDVEVDFHEANLPVFQNLARIAQRSPDWWRQIAAYAVTVSGQTISATNKHFPTEYEAAVFGDPRIVFEAGDPAGSDIYLSLHAERGIVAICAREGISLKGASVYINTFPCGDCARILAECGIKELFFLEGCSLLKGFEILRDAGVRIVQIKESPVQSE